MTLRPLLLCIALATLALAPEALAQTANPLRLSVERGLNFLRSKQNPQSG